MFPNGNKAGTPSDDVGLSRIPGLFIPENRESVTGFGTSLATKELSRKRSQSGCFSDCVSGNSSIPVCIAKQSSKRSNIHIQSNSKHTPHVSVSRHSIQASSDQFLSAPSIKRPSSLPIPSHDSVHSRLRADDITCCKNSKIFEQLNVTYTPTADVISLPTVDSRIKRSNSASSLQAQDKHHVSSAGSPMLFGAMHSEQSSKLCWEPLSPSSVGDCKPILAPTSFSCCMLCRSKFSLVRQKHHCQACGRLLCTSCCGQRYNLPFSVSAYLGYRYAHYSRRPRTTVAFSTRSSPTNKFLKYQRNSHTSLYTRHSKVCFECYNILTNNELRLHPKTIQNPCHVNTVTSTSVTGQISTVYQEMYYSIENENIIKNEFNLDKCLQLRFDPIISHANSSHLSDFSPLKISQNEDELMQFDYWPPLVISIHSELVLQYNPPISLLISLLDTGTNSTDNDNVFDAQNKRQIIRGDDQLSPSSSTESSLSVMDTIDRSPFGKHLSATEWIPPGVTVALTRNLYVHVHSTELNCCLKQPAWCYSSNGFYQYGQEEIVILLRKRPNEHLPPKEIFQQYVCIYKALIMSNTQVRSTNEVKFESFDFQAFNVWSSSFNSAPFRSHDCFFPHRYPTPKSQFSECDTTKPPSVFQFGLLFFHPTHQCLRGLQLPNSSPFLIGVLIHPDEFNWAYRLPARLLLRLGRLGLYYPTPLLSDRDRQVVFDCNKGISVLQLFTNLNDISSLSSSITIKNTQTKSSELYFRMKRFYVQLNCGDCVLNDSKSGCQTVLELLMPLSSHTALTAFIDSFSSDVTAFVLAADFDPFSDSHLVCIQSANDSYQKSSALDLIEFNQKVNESSSSHHDIFSRIRFRDYLTSAISIKDTKPRIIGANFVIFSADATTQLSVDIIEDGFCVHLTTADLNDLINALKSAANYKLTVDDDDKLCTNQESGLYDSIETAGVGAADVTRPSINFVDNIRLINLKWFENVTSVLTTVPTTCLDLTTSYQISFVDMQYLRPLCTYLVPIHYQLHHWSRLIQTNFCTDNYLYNKKLFCSPINNVEKQCFGMKENLRLIWTRFHILNTNKRAHCIDSSSNKFINLAKLADSVAEPMVQALQPYLNKLRINNRTHIALRIQLQPPDLVGYQLGAACNEFGLQITNTNNYNDLDLTDKMFAVRINELLLPVLNDWVSCLKFEAFKDNGSDAETDQIEEENQCGIKQANQRHVGSQNQKYVHPTLVMELDFSILD